MVKSIAMIMIPAYWFFQLEMCRQLKKEANCKVTLYVGSQDSKKSIENNLEAEFYDDIVIRNFLASPYPNDVNPDEIFAEAKRWEKYLGCNYNDLIMTNRVFGRGYALGGYFHGRSFTSEKNDHVRIIKIYNEEIEFWDNELKSRNIDLFINPLKIQFVLCRKLDISARLICSSRHENFYYWGFDEFVENPDFEKNFKTISGAGLSPVVKDTGYSNDMLFRKDFFKRYGFVQFTKRTYLRIYYRLINIIKRDEARFGSYIWSNTMRHLRANLDGRKMTNPKRKYITPMDEIKKNKNFFYPLATEPEWTMQGQSPDFFCQLWAITLAAKAMPADTYLTVKEHIYPIGARPKNFYDQIIEFKNIRMVSAGIHGLEVTKQARGVITINGTTGYEAAMLGIPVIVLASHCDYSFLDHVFHCPKGEGLEQAVREIDQKGIDVEKAKNDGARFLKAIIASSFSMNDYSILKPENLDPQIVKNAIQHLLKSLDSTVNDATEEQQISNIRIKNA